MSYLDYATGLTMTNKKFDALFGGPPRTSEAELTRREMDLAASVQKVTEDIIVKLAKNIANKRKKYIYAIYETKNQLISFFTTK